ncbi:MAG TPA: hypothetical protein VFS10_06785, partial [Pyrinomonadaceae bacterium]|nr:hypothetical protein [Pyrinomonadaceae bacterium]
MKHRSVIAFVLLAAIFAAVPQASQDLSELKSALGQRVRNGIWHALLSLNERGGAVQSASRRAPQQHTLASCNAPASPGSKKSSAPSRAATARPEATEAARHVAAGDLAMMLTPLADIEEKIELQVAEGVQGLVIGKVLKAPSGAPLPAQEMAMIIPPGEAPDAPARLEAAARSHSRRAERESRVSYIATAFDERGVEFRKVGDVMHFQFDNSPKDGVALPLP